MLVLSLLMFLAYETYIAFVMTDGMVVAICGVLTAVVMQISLVVMFLLKNAADDRHRAEDKQARADLAALTKTGLDTTAASISENTLEGGKREERIVAKVAEFAVKADAAYIAGNGNQEKFAEVQAVLLTHAKALETPTRVEVVNDSHHPVPTTIK